MQAQRELSIYLNIFWTELLQLSLFADEFYCYENEKHIKLRNAILNAYWTPKKFAFYIYFVYQKKDKGLKLTTQNFQEKYVQRLCPFLKQN